MNLSKKSILAALLLSSAVFTNAAPDTGLAQPETADSLDLSSTSQEKLTKFRDAFVEWKNQHAITYDMAETEIQKMKTWIHNHGEQSATVLLRRVHCQHNTATTCFQSRLCVCMRVCVLSVQ